MNVGRFLSLAAERDPARCAFICGDDRVTYGEVQGRVSALGAGLRARGLRPGDRVGIYMRNCPQVVESMFAVWQAGGCVVPLNARFVADEVAYHLNDCRAKAIIHDDDGHAAVAAARPALASTDLYVTTGSVREAADSYESLVGDHLGASPDQVETRDDELAWLFYTSGTTGRPKGAMLTHGNLTFAAVSWSADLSHLEAEDVGLHAAPLSHGAGFQALALTAKAATHVIPTWQRFDPRAFCETVERHSVTTTWLVPTQIKMLLMSPDLDRFDLSSLRWIIYGGAPMYAQDLREALRRLGRVLVQLYGQGETPMTATYLRREDHVTDGPETIVRRLGSCGRPRTGVEVAVLDESDREVRRGTTGEICVRGPSVFAGYWERPQETQDALRNGWLHTGDLGQMDDYAYVYIMDRRKDMVISGGSNVYPREVEEVLLRHPAVHEACVIGVPDPLWGEAVKAVVVLRPGVTATAEQLVGFCAAHLAGYKKPRSIDFVDGLPKNAYGKVLKRELRARYRQGQDRSAGDLS